MGIDVKRTDLLKQYPGVGADRIVERTQGCWNCVHFNLEKAKNHWWEKARQDLLNKATTLAVSSPLGESHPKVLAIRQMVPMVDGGIERHEWGMCRVGKQPDGSPVGEFVHRVYLCQIWTGAEGASVAREGQKADMLPEEVMDRTFDPKKID